MPRILPGFCNFHISIIYKISDHSFTLKVNLNVKQGGKRLEHQGIRIEFVGQIGERPFLSCVYCRNHWLCVFVEYIVVFQITPLHIRNSNALTVQTVGNANHVNC